MTLESIRQVHQVRPFQSFTIHLADGRKVRIEHPEWLSIPPGEKGRTIVAWAPSGEVRLIDLLLVVEIELDQSKPRRRSA